MRILITLLALTTIACGEDATPTTQVVPIQPTATTAPADAPAAADAAPSHPWVCPMCDGVSSDQPGDCPKCGMPLVQPEDVASVDAEAYHAAEHAGHDHAAHADCPHKAKAEGEDCDCDKKGEHAGHDHAGHDHAAHADCPHHKAEAATE
jgi:hypothetical protein